MSLVFLKNREIEYDNDNQETRPHFKWGNTFNTPLKLPPNSQVAYIQSTIAFAKSISISTENDALYICIGHPTINPTMRIPLEQGQSKSTYAMAQHLNTQLNTWSHQADWKTTEQAVVGGLSVNNNGFTCLYDALALKFNYACIQRETNPLQFVGYNICRSGAIVSYTGTSQLDTLTLPSPSGNIGFLPTSAIASPTPSTDLWNVGFNQIRVNGGEALPGSGGNGDCINDVLSGTTQGALFNMWSSKTGIKRCGLSTQVPSAFNEVIYGMRRNTTAYDPPIVGGDTISHFAGLIPRYWLEATNTPGIKDNTRERHLTDCDVNTNGGTARYMFGHRIEMTPLSPRLGWVIPQINTGSYERPLYKDLGDGVNLATLPIVGAAPVGHTFFRYRMEDPYTCSLSVCKDYDELTGTSTAGWVNVFNWKDGTNPGAASPETWISPSWFGDMCLVQYQAYQLGTTMMRGNFDLIQSFTGENNSDGGILQPFPYTAYQVALQNRMGAIQTGVGKFSGSIEEFNADGFGEKQMYITHNPCNNLTDLDTNLNIPLFKIPFTGIIDDGYTYPLDPTTSKYFTLSAPQTSLGYELGFGSEAVVEVETGAPSPFQTYKAVALKNLQDSKNVNSVHIQLTNLPIQSMNAMIQDGCKDIAVVPCYDEQKVNDEDAVHNMDIYHHQVGEKNWVDLNNIQTLYLNNVDVYLSYDDNTPAYGIRDETDVLVMFRQKPTNNTLLPMNVGTLPGQNPYQNTIQEI